MNTSDMQKHITALDTENGRLRGHVKDGARLIATLRVTLDNAGEEARSANAELADTQSELACAEAVADVYADSLADAEDTIAELEAAITALMAAMAPPSKFQQRVQSWL